MYAEYPISQLEYNLGYNCIDCNNVRFQSTRDIYVRTYTLQAVNRLYVQQCGVLYRRYVPLWRAKRKLFFVTTVSRRAAGPLAMAEV